MIEPVSMRFAWDDGRGPEILAAFSVDPLAPFALEEELHELARAIAALEVKGE